MSDVHVSASSDKSAKELVDDVIQNLDQALKCVLRASTSAVALCSHKDVPVDPKNTVLQKAAALLTLNEGVCAFKRAFGEIKEDMP